MKTKPSNPKSSSPIYCLLIMVPVFLLTTTPSEAAAWKAKTCYGRPYYGIQEDQQLVAAKISFPKGSRTRRALQHAVNEWNKVWGMKDRLELRFKDLNRVKFGNGRNEIGLSPDTDYIWKDGTACNALVGRKMALHNTNVPNGEVTEFDILIDSENIFQHNNTCVMDRHGTTGYAEILHELGHALGMYHDNRPHSYLQEMAAATDIPLVASGGVTTLDDVRALVAANMPAAIIGRALYEGHLELPQVLELADDLT